MAKKSKSPAEQGPPTFDRQAHDAEWRVRMDSYFLNDHTKPAVPPVRPEIVKEIQDKAVEKVARPGGIITGKRKSEVADEWRIPAVLFAETIWLEFPDLRTATVGKRIRKLLSEDEQPPSDRALTDLIGPLKPQR